MHRNTNNLTYLGRFPTLSKGPSNPKLEREMIQRTRVIKKAIYKCCSQELAEKAINGYRRSDDSGRSQNEDFLRSDQPYFPVNRDKHYKRALQVCEKIFRPSRKLHPVAVPDLRYYPWTLNTSAEAPYTTHYKRYLPIIRENVRDGLAINLNPTFHNLYDKIFIDQRKWIHDIKKGKRQFWQDDGTPIPFEQTTLHTRAHIVSQDDPDKLRAVFGVPKLLLFSEQMFIWPIMKDYLNHKTGRMLWGYETLKGGWKKLYNRFSHKRIQTYVSIDWSQFDRRALHQVIDDIHIIWRSWFDFTRYEPTNFYPNGKPNPSEIERIWKWMTYSVKHTPIVTPDGHLYQWKWNGIASGFQQTQLLDSFVNTIMTLTCLSSIGINIESENFDYLVQGDDSLFGMAEFIHPNWQRQWLVKLRDEAMLRFNAKLSHKKSTIGNHLNSISVLSYENDNGIAKRDPASFLAHLLYPEYPQTLEATISSSIGIAQAAMGSSKEVYNTCKDVYNFLTEQFKLDQAKNYRLRLNLQRRRTAQPLLPKHFPSFQETFLQNYDLTGRTESDNERLWPTKESSAGGFYFLKP